MLAAASISSILSRGIAKESSDKKTARKLECRAAQREKEIPLSHDQYRSAHRSGAGAKHGDVHSGRECSGIDAELVPPRIMEAFRKCRDLAAQRIIQSKQRVGRRGKGEGNGRRSGER